MKASYALVLLLAAGCYHPKIADGAFACGDGNSCPEGFSCAADHRCRASTGQIDLGGGGGDLGADLGPGRAFVGTGALGPLDLSGKTGEIDVNTENGEIDFIADGADGGAPMMLVPPNAGGFQNIAQPSGGPHVGIWNFSQVVIPKGITVKPASPDKSVLVLAATGDLSIAGDIDFRLFGGFGGTAGMTGSTRSSGVASGGGGAQNDSSGAGGGGAGYKDVGLSGMGTGAGMGGALYGSGNLVPIHVGSGGGGGGAPVTDGGATSFAGRGGAGGGAVALFGASVTISGTIDVRGNPGADGVSTTSPAGGGGGGSGGSILLSGISVVLNSGHDLLVAGGGGGMGTLGAGGPTGNSGGAGSAGRIFIGSTQLTGSVQSDTPAVLGGAGSAITTFPR